MRVVGVDEAGRGSAIGPLVVAGVAFPDDELDALVNLGVRDSKKLNVRKREYLTKNIEYLASEIVYYELQPNSIDLVVTKGIKLRRLNYLEAVAMARVIRDLAPEKAYVDASDVNETRFGETILRLLPIKPKLICEHKADSTYPIVSAASILAKVRRDSIITSLKEEYGDFNSGYPSDWRAIIWLKNWYREHGSWPNIVRHSWEPVKRIKLDATQTKLAITNS